MMRSFLIAAAALVGGLSAQSPCETAWYNVVNPATGTNFGLYYYSATVQPITQLYDVTFNQDLILSQLDLYTGAQYGFNGEMNLYFTAAGGTSVGNQTNAAAWTQVSHLTQVHAGGTVSWVLNPPVGVQAGTYGVAIQTIGASPLFHYTPESALLPQTYSTTEMTIDATNARIRGSQAGAAFGGTAAGYAPCQPIHRWHYTTDVRVCDFEATPTEGFTPLPVQFSPIAASTDPLGILVYEWDFGDGSPLDYNTAPLHTYTTCGNYTVSLTITDALGSATTTKTDFVVTDLMTPKFTYSLIGGTLVQFQDATTPTPPAGATYSWDLDGDGNLGDDTTTAPVWAYTNIGDEINVTLEVTYGCQGPFTYSQKIVVGQVIESTFQSGLITASPQLSSGNLMDVNVVNPQGVNIHAMQVNSSVGVGLPVTVNLYQCEGTYVGKETDASLWRQVGSYVATSAGTGGRTLVNFNPPIHLASGSWGLCMEHVEASPVYTNLGGTQVYSNSDLTLTLGASVLQVFTPGTTIFTPRIANLAFSYTTSASNGTPGYGYIGFGCPGTAGVPSNRALTPASINTTLTIEIGNLPTGIAVAALGASRSPAAVDLGVLLGMTGCNLFSSPDVIQPVIGAPGAVTYGVALPNDPTLVGRILYDTAISLDPGINSFDFTISDSAEFLIGL
ncbi:MAG: PKD domain-containing protein [Planctomycetes bacterium]|nr:PKD domain-containing protein [Planctomycetota bacterium]